MKNKIWVTSDLHFFHTNIINHCNRPVHTDLSIFPNDNILSDYHNDWIIERLNAYIGKNDIVYHLGDFAFGRNCSYENIKNIISRLNGKWRFIIGNHDKENQLINICNDLQTHKVLGLYHEMKHNGKNLIMFHYPIESWNKQRYGSIHLHGHLHNRKTRIEIDNRINVCFDNNNYNPILLDTLTGEI